MTAGNLSPASRPDERPHPAPRRLLSHDYFELRVEEECHRAARKGVRFAVVRLSCAREDSHAAEEVLAGALRLTDVLAREQEGHYEALLTDATPEEAEPAIERLRAALLAAGIDGQLRVVRYPGDGSSADALLSPALRPDAPKATLLPPAPPHESAPANPAAREASSLAPLDAMLRLVAPSDLSVLVLGETGAGKERIAHELHARSRRAQGPFVCLNCAALTEPLLESELFGHERGAFTGAQAAKPGLLETARGGTVFLDEVGELPLSLQGKLLRVFEERLVRRVGGLSPRAIDVRFVAATNRDLESGIARGTFRQDLFFRLNGFTLYVPPLRERVEEIADLARLFAQGAAARAGRPVPQLAPEVLERLLAYPWPGNVRELRNVIERAVVLCGDGPLTLAHLPVEKLGTPFAERRTPARELPPAAPLTKAAPPAPEPSPLLRGGEARLPSGSRLRALLPDEVMEEVASYERQRIVDALAACAGNQTEAARRLGISRRTLVSRLSAFQLPRPRKRSATGES